MAEPATEPPTVRPLSRFSASTSPNPAPETSLLERNVSIVPMPKWSNIVGLARLVLAILVLAFTATSTAMFGGFAAFGLPLFTASATLLIFAYYHVALSRRPKWYNRWAILGLEIFGLIFWLASFALLANFTSLFSGFNPNARFDTRDSWNGPYNMNGMGSTDRPRVRRKHLNFHAGVALAGTAAGLGAVEFILYTLTLVIFGIALHKQRMETSAGSTSDAQPPPTGPSEVHQSPPASEEKAEVESHVV